MKVEYGVARTYEDLINNTTSELLWIDGKKVEEAELVVDEEKSSKSIITNRRKQESERYGEIICQTKSQKLKTSYHSASGTMLM